LNAKRILAYTELAIIDKINFFLDFLEFSTQAGISAGVRYEPKTSN